MVTHMARLDIRIEIDEATSSNGLLSATQYRELIGG